MTRLRLAYFLVFVITGACSYGVTISVTTTNDAGAGSLRQAILDSNSSTGVLDTIAFNIPGTNVNTITPATKLPAITDPVIIDGYTQPGASANTLTNDDDAVLMIELNGSHFSTSSGAADGLLITAGNTTVRGLIMNHFNDFGGSFSVIAIRSRTRGNNVIEGNLLGTDSTGTNVFNISQSSVWIESGSSNNLIGGTTPAARNVISGGIAIEILDNSCSGNVIQGNFIGTDRHGTGLLAIGDGIDSSGPNTIIGGTTPGARNVIVSSYTAVWISSDMNVVQGNFIGTDVTGTSSLGSGAVGVEVTGSSNTVGGATATARNIISGNRFEEIVVQNGSGNTIQGNFIGTDITGTNSLGNGTGVLIYSSGNVIGGTNNGAGNIIAFSIENMPVNVTGDGIIVYSGTNNVILANSIFSNGGLGINLGIDSVTTNDAGDADDGPNHLQNYPVLTSVSNSANGVVIQGVLDGATVATFRLEFFANSEADPSGFGQGEMFIGYTNVTTAADGTNIFTVTFPGVVSDSAFVTATATDPNGNTSEFSHWIAASPVILSKVRPPTGGDIGPVTVLISGFGFSDGATVKLMQAGQPDIVADSLAIGQNGLLITATFDLNGKAQGLWDLVLITADGTTLTLPQAFTIEAGIPAQVWVDIVGRDRTAPGRQQTFFIMYGKLGNVDSDPVTVSISFPQFVTGSLSNAPGPTVAGETDDGDAFISVNIPPVGTATSSMLLNLTVTNAVEFIGQSFEVSTWVDSSSATPISAITHSLATITSSQDSEQMVRDELALVSPSEIGPNISIKNAACPPGCEHPAFVPCSQDLPSVCSNGCTEVGGLRRSVVDGVVDLLFASGSDLLITGGSECDGHGRNGACSHPRGYKVDLRTNSALAGFIMNNYTHVVDRVRHIHGVTVQEPRWRDDDSGALFVLESDHWDVELPDSNGKCGDKRKTIKVVASLDPNDKAGSDGVGEARYLMGQEPLRYAIFFENKDTATAPAQEVVITDRLDVVTMDLTTLNLGPIVFGDNVAVPPPGSNQFITDVDLRTNQNLIVHIETTLNSTNGVLTWRFTSIDPDTDQPPADPSIGFLPANVNPPEGQGSVLFTILPKQELPTGTVIANGASITFDLNPAIATPTWTNTIDNAKPSSTVLPLASSQQPRFPVQWSGSDAGSSIKDFTIFVSQDGGPFLPWLINSSATSGMFIGQLGSTYGFYSVAEDETGNTEDAPAFAEASTTVTIGHDLGVVKMKAPKKISLSGTVTNVVGRFSVSIQNLSPHTEVISNLATLANLVTVDIQSLGACAGIAATLVPPHATFPITLLPKKKLNLAFEANFGCANDPASGTGRQDYKSAVRVNHAALDGQPDTTPSNDNCPRGPNGGDKGCGNKTPAGTLGADVLTDVVVK